MVEVGVDGDHSTFSSNSFFLSFFCPNRRVKIALVGVTSPTPPPAMPLNLVHDLCFIVLFNCIYIKQVNNKSLHVMQLPQLQEHIF